MALKPDDSSKGLWCDASIRDNDHALHAVIIGITAYRHLPGGPGPVAAQTMGMTQLAVSASGAAQIFDWLRTTGSMASRPVATCRLLLAPGNSKGHDGTTERAFVQKLTGGWYADPTYSICERAIQDWADEFFKTPEPLKKEKAAFFFFSGHGLEVLAKPSLLASDVLAPGTGQGRNNAIAYKSILTALPTYGVGDALFFFDSCRSAPDVAKRLNIVGRDVLEPNPDGAVEPDCFAWLKASEAGQKAYSDPMGSRRASLFGQSLIEALEGVPPEFDPYDRRLVPWQLNFEVLEGFTKARVRTLLQAAGSMRVQTVIPGGDPYSGATVVAQRNPPPKVSPNLGLPSIPATLSTVVARRSAEVLERFTVGSSRPGFETEVRSLSDFTSMHEVFGSESITAPWTSMLSITSETGQTAALRPLSGKTSPLDNLSWIDVELEPGDGYVWVALDAAKWLGDKKVRPNSFGVLLPRDRTPVPVRLEYSFKPTARLHAPTGLTARLAEPTPGLSAAIWTTLWEAQRVSSLASLGGALSQLPNMTEPFERAVREKRSSPLAAAIGIATLLDAGALDQLHDWPRNLANWFEELPEGPVLWAETILRRGRRLSGGAGRSHVSMDDESMREAFNMWSKIAERGAPRLGPVLAMALEQAEFWRTEVSSTDATRVREVEAVLSSASDAAADTLFLSFNADIDHIEVPLAFRIRAEALATSGGNY